MSEPCDNCGYPEAQHYPGGPTWKICEDFTPAIDGVTFNRDNKFDYQLRASLAKERGLAKLFATGTFEKIEQKDENYQWEQKGNICIEYQQNGQPSGIAVTEADVWVHQLWRDGKVLVSLLFPMERLKELARKYYKEGRYTTRGGDSKHVCNILIPISEILSGGTADGSKFP